MSGRIDIKAQRQPMAFVGFSWVWLRVGLGWFGFTAPGVTRRSGSLLTPLLALRPAPW